MIKLVIFDCDGVLVDSEVIALEVEQRHLATLGLQLDLDEISERFVGISAESMKQSIEQQLGVYLPDGFMKRTEADTVGRFADELRSINGIKDTLERIEMPRCVASSSSPDRIERSLTITGLVHHFSPYIYSASMVRQGKPAPDLFLHAARNMGVAPEDCLVIEDSTAGIRAAKAAGMRVFAFSGGGHAHSAAYRTRLDRLGPNLHFDDMRRLPAMIEAL